MADSGYYVISPAAQEENGDLVLTAGADGRLWQSPGKKITPSQVFHVNADGLIRPTLHGTNRFAHSGSKTKHDLDYNRYDSLHGTKASAATHWATTYFGDDATYSIAGTSLVEGVLYSRVWTGGGKRDEEARVYWADFGATVADSRWCLQKSAPVPKVAWADCSVGKFGKLGSTWWREVRFQLPTGQYKLPEGTKLAVGAKDQYNVPWFWVNGWFPKKINVAKKGHAWKVPGWGIPLPLYASGYYDSGTNIFRLKSGGKEVSDTNSSFPSKQHRLHSFQYVLPGNIMGPPAIIDFHDVMDVRCGADIERQGEEFW
ncbi:hypothetical protein H8N01_31045 [Streptomyces sp. AC536]|uniref:hypothetical protein n=1 Tax=Streptomyces buecherae TaxID=2763006 RepID=UPI00164E6914|nr:hypothetical protein [Streptomyces buecherae]MBC3986902.1 hypothetical protein [Streptomyces buecherae]QNJ43233.1 hypothetical protein H7H31_28770 [Streptomyces buecherae]